MSLALSAVWSDRCLLHEPAGEVWIGLRTEGTEVPARAERIRDALLERGAPLVEAGSHPDDALTRAHDPGLVAYLETAWDEWAAAGLPEDPGQDRVVPYVFAHAALTAERPARVPEAVWARPGYFAYDTMTLVGPGTWEAVRAAADVALSAVDLVLDGERAAYACCRPPGHHACRRCFGGSCYLNNAAIAAAALRTGVERPVAVLDLDAHHGNGTQEIFYRRGDVLVGSVHVDPGAGWFPHFLGFADEAGAGPGRGANLNLPLPPGAADDGWLEAVSALVAWALAAEPGALVVSLGVDAAEADPESPLLVSASGFREAGRMLGAMDLPTVLVQEGGYDLESLGALVGETLTGVEEGLP